MKNPPKVFAALFVLAALALMTVRVGAQSGNNSNGTSQNNSNSSNPPAKPPAAGCDC